MRIWEVDQRLWDWIMGVNAQRVINGIRTFVPHLVAQEEGHVINTASQGALRANGRLGTYATTKYAVMAIAESLKGDLACTGANVGVSVVCPSAVPTALTETSAANWPDDVPRPDVTEPRNDGSMPFSLIAPEVVADIIHDGI